VKVKQISTRILLVFRFQRKKKGARVCARTKKFPMERRVSQLFNGGLEKFLACFLTTVECFEGPCAYVDGK